jgi:hypothetical protein
VRSHYLTSITAVNIGLVLLFTYSFKDSMNSLWLPLTAVPYFYLYGRDLVSLKYRWSDLLRVYALNLMLIPVNLGGVFKSISQGISGNQIPFGRTPKVDGRTSVPRVYALAVLALAAWCVSATVIDTYYEHFGHAVFSALNGTFLIYAITKFIGWRECFADLGLLNTSQANAAAVQMTDADIIHLNEKSITERKSFDLASVFPIKHRDGRYIRQFRRKIPEAMTE